MADLVPAPETLGLSSPSIGPWFSSPTLTLAPPNADLAVPVSLVPNDQWLPATSGLFSVLLATPTRPAALRRLRRASGEAAFADGNLVLLFRFLPEAEERLHAIGRYLPAPDRAAATTPAGTVATRPKARWLALELIFDDVLVDAQERLKRVIGYVDAALPINDGEIATSAADLGLEWKDGAIGNAATAMSDLHRPGLYTDPITSVPVSDPIVRITSAQDVRLWAFDSSGRAFDPGALAAWHLTLASTYPNLWAPGLTGKQRTCLVQARRTAQLVDAHERQLEDGSPLLARLFRTGAAATSAGQQLVHESTTAALELSVEPPAGDDPGAAVPRVALLPAGTYGASLQLWGPSSEPVTRDFVRVALVDVEKHLVGLGRDVDAQRRKTTRIAVNRTRADERVLLAHAEESAAAGLRALSGDGRGYVISSVLDRDFGLGRSTIAALLEPAQTAQYPVADGLPDVPPPGSIPDPVVEAITGGGAANGSEATGQKVLFTLELDPAYRGAWVRVWTQGFDAEMGEHVKLDGAAGRADHGGSRPRAVLTLPLPDGAISSPPTLLGVSVLVATRQGARVYTEKRFSRPAPIGGTAVGFVVGGDGLTLAAAFDEVLVCEAGTSASGNRVVASSVGSGHQVVARRTGQSPVLVNRTLLPAAALAAEVLVRVLPAGLTLQVELTRPAFKTTPEGDVQSVLGNATVHRQDRRNPSGWNVLGSGEPAPMMERLEVVCARVGTNEARALVGSTPPLGRYHELAPHRYGHPGAPAAPDLHGAGVNLSGGAALAVLEAARDRAHRLTHEMVRERVEHPDPVLSSSTYEPGVWAALLRTVAPLVEGDISNDLLAAVGGNPTGIDNRVQWALERYRKLRTWLINQGVGWTPPDYTDEQVWPVVRAFDRRLVAHSEGLHEAHTALVAAIGRAEDFIYVETPAIDVRPISGTTPVWKAIKERLEARPALHVLLCLPARLAPGCPKKVRQMRDALAFEALATLDGVPGIEQRFAWFSPSAGPGRHLRLASTTVVVDDAFALTGTTHLWRRGMTFDSSMAVAIFDERLEHGRPRELRRLRRQLMADALGLRATSYVPEDPAEIIDAVRSLGHQGHGGRFSSPPLVDPGIEIAETNVWNPDATLASGFSVLDWVLQLAATNVLADLNGEV